MAAMMKQEQLARGLGWFSIGLGLAQVAMPRRFSKMIGVNGRPSLIRSIGLREITSGVGILANRKPAGWIGTRIAGDVMDLSLLALAMRSNDARRTKAAAAAVAGITALDVLCRQRLASGVQAIRESVAVNRPPEALYRFWRDPQNLPRIMNNIESVQKTGERRWHWVAKGPAGTRLEWDTDIIDDRPNEVLSWRSAEDAAIQTTGSVRFERLPAGRGTAVNVEMYYYAPGATLGASFAKLLSDAPKQQVWEALRSFKQIMETGEVATTVGQPAGHRPVSLLQKLDEARQA